MKFFNKSIMTIALTGAMFGSAFVTTQLLAEPIVSSGGDVAGDVLLYPYYTTRNGFQTQISIVNTSPTDTTIAKLRLRDYKNSDDVLDITVIMSPNDVFAGTISAEDGKTIFTRSKNDTTCTAPFADANRQYVQGGNDTTRNKYADAGHIEVLTMATIPEGVDADLYPHLARVVANSTHLTTTGKTPATVGTGCGVVNDYFDLDAGVNGYEISDLQEELDDIYDTAYAGGNENAEVIRSTLVGSYAIVKTSGGISAAGRPVTIAGAFTSNTNTAYGPSANVLYSACNEVSVAGLAQAVGNGDDNNNGINNSIICAQVPTSGHFTFPHLANVPGVDAMLANRTAAQNVTSFNVFQTALAKAGMASEWSRNAEHNVQSEMIFTLPTKYVLRDDYPSSTIDTWNTIATRWTSKDTFTRTLAGVVGVAAINGGDAPLYLASETSKWDDVDLAVMSDLNGSVGIFNDVDPQVGCMSFGQTAFDREEQRFIPAGGGTVVSGGQEQAVVEDKICNESTVFTFGDGQGVTQSNTEDNTIKIDTTDLSQPYGWLNVTSLETNNSPIRVPMIGYTMSSRDLAGASGGNFAHLVNNIGL